VNTLYIQLLTHEQHFLQNVNDLYPTPKFHVPTTNVSSIIAIKVKAKEIFAWRPSA
jgi:hypothetical protein